MEWPIRKQCIQGELRMMARESMSIYGKQEPEYDGEGDPA